MILLFNASQQDLTKLYNDDLIYTLVDIGTDGLCTLDGTIVTYVPNADFPATNDASGVDTCSFYATDDMGLDNSVSNTSLGNAEI